MKVALFVPCYVDQFYPQVGVATLQVLERAGCQVVFPARQTCCGQPMANAGYAAAAIPAAAHFVRVFADYEYVVAPSGSCVAHVRAHYDVLEQSAAVRHVRERTYELCQFLTEVLGVEEVPASFPYRVGLQHGCHGLRMLGLGKPSERPGPPYDRVRQLLERVQGLELVPLDRADECCGFGGTFAVTEEAVSVYLGLERLEDHLRNGAEVITSTDMSCLMHLQGLVRRRQYGPRVVHVAEILNSAA